MTKRTGLVWHETFMWHRQGNYSGLMPGEFPVQPGHHYETAEGKRRIKNLLDASGFTDRLISVKPRTATREELLRVHTPEYLDQLEADNLLAEASAGFDAPFARGSYDLARLASGGAIEAAQSIVNGEIDNAYLLARPIGHHAQSSIGKGFCMVNNAAIAAAHVLATTDISRIAFIDIDVHHGNGAEEIFWSNPNALTISIHQDLWFPPDSGQVSAVGEGAGKNFNLNVPLPAGSGFGAYQAAFEDVILPALDLYKPEMIFMPTGYDASAQDPLGRMILSSNSFRYMATQIKNSAEKHSKGRLLLTHEGGYNEAIGPFLALAVLEAISEMDSGVIDPYGEIFDGMHGMEILPHQRQAVDNARNNLNGLAEAIHIFD